MNPLFVRRQGRGPALVLLHGWALHGGVFAATAAVLAAQYTVYTIDLPGHGASPYELRPAADMDPLFAWAEDVLAAAPPRAAWIGWSLGGLIALRAAQMAPERIERLLLLASTPRFTVADDWPAGLRPAVFQQFGRELLDDHARTIARFLALQTLGSTAPVANLRGLRETLAQRPPQPQALHAGLELLHRSDLRAAFAALPLPIAALYGAHDRLVPAAQAGDLARLRPDVRTEILADAAHMPFLSHPAQFLRAVHDWLADVRSAQALPNRD